MYQFKRFNSQSHKSNRQNGVSSFWREKFVIPSYNLPVILSFYHRKKLETSLLDSIQYYKIILVACDYFEFLPNSPIVKTLHRTTAMICRCLFLYLGCALQFLALLQYSALAEVSTILSLAPVYLNLSVKDVVFQLKRQQLEKLWNTLDDSDFRASEDGEFK